MQQLNSMRDGATQGIYQVQGQVGMEVGDGMMMFVYFGLRHCMLCDIGWHDGCTISVMFHPQVEREDTTKTQADSTPGFMSAPLNFNALSYREPSK